MAAAAEEEGELEVRGKGPGEGLRPTTGLGPGQR